ncbi:hypothetical protein OJAV_G00220340 [Oryzias javanicus]|uniref:Uncharacterized protein n=1 Tax=Oryzias javanicus TaxID=123683 RepID=A0A437C0S2_ORYJA|nr:hypothetical protein OJAV_G00220340 [Oryzias javanicus]
MSVKGQIWRQAPKGECQSTKRGRGVTATLLLVRLLGVRAPERGGVHIRLLRGSLKRCVSWTPRPEDVEPCCSAGEVDPSFSK